MALRILEKCESCINDCKLETDDKIYKEVHIVSCPRGKKYKKKEKTTKK